MQDVEHHLLRFEGDHPLRSTDEGEVEAVVPDVRASVDEDVAAGEAWTDARQRPVLEEVAVAEDVALDPVLLRIRQPHPHVLVSVHEVDHPLRAQVRELQLYLIRARNGFAVPLLGKHLYGRARSARATVDGPPFETR